MTGRISPLALLDRMSVTFLLRRLVGRSRLEGASFSLNLETDPDADAGMGGKDTCMGCLPNGRRRTFFGRMINSRHLGQVSKQILELSEGALIARFIGEHRQGHWVWEGQL